MAETRGHRDDRPRRDAFKIAAGQEPFPGTQAKLGLAPAKAGGEVPLKL